MPYIDLNTIHVPVVGQVVPAAWGVGVRANQEYMARNRPQVKAYSGSSSLVISGVASILPCTAEDWDVGGMHSTFSNNSRLTVPSGEDGKYRGVAWVDMVDATGTPDGRRAIRIRKNGADLIASDSRQCDPVGTTAITVPWEDDLVAGDYVQVEVLHTDSGDLDCTVKFFTAEWKSL